MCYHFMCWPNNISIYKKGMDIELNEIIQNWGLFLDSIKMIKIQILICKSRNNLQHYEIQ